MFHYCLPWLAAFCCAAVSGAPAGKERPEEPAVAISLEGWQASVREFWPSPSSRWEFSMDLGIKEVSPSWKVAYSEEGTPELTLADSEGSSPARMNCEYSSSHFSERGNKAGTIYLRTDSWLPSEGAGWVEARGKVALVMYGSTAVSESVTLKVTVKDFSVPLVLKNAGMGGADVKVELKGYYDDRDQEEAHTLRIRVYSPVPLGFLGVELQSRNGTPLLAENYGSSSGRSSRSYDYHQYFRIQGDKEEELKVAVKYGAGLKKIITPVKIRCGLFGVAEGQDDRNREN